MEIIWSISDDDVLKVEKIINDNRNAFLRVRRKRNVDRKNLQVNKDTVIRTLLMCLLTSQQRSGPNSKVGQYLRKSPFPITYGSIQQTDNVETFIKDVLAENHLTRFRNRIGKFFAANIRKFSENHWHIVPALKELLQFDSKVEERKIADNLAKKLDGFGPKQARNFLQALGLTRYEIPIDSRITNWLNKFGFPVALSSSPLGDTEYYYFVLDGVQELCGKAEVYPCMLDAAVFSSFDNNGWTEENAIF